MIVEAAIAHKRISGVAILSASSDDGATPRLLAPRDARFAEESGDLAAISAQAGFIQDGARVRLTPA